MERPVARVWVLAVLAVCVSACSSPESRFTAPTPTPPPVAAAPPAPAPAPQPPPLPFPPPSGPSRVYDFASPLTRIVADYTRASRYVLYDNGAFELQYYRLGGSYRGRYEQTETAVTFHWEGWSSAGAWGASGSLDGDMLTVRYNFIMQLTDFEDAVYQLQH
jgi:hypothetical protein